MMKSICLAVLFVFAASVSLADNRPTAGSVACYEKSLANGIAMTIIEEGVEFAEEEVTYRFARGECAKVLFSIEAYKEGTPVEAYPYEEDTSYAELLERFQNGDRPEQKTMYVPEGFPVELFN